MNDKQQELIRAVQELLDDTIHTMEQDEFFAPAKWVLENMWNTLECVFKVSSSNHDEDPATL